MRQGNDRSQNTYTWPYPNEAGVEETVLSDVLVLGGGLSGCFAAIAAAKKGQSVVLVEKGEVERSGCAGTGFDHWESCCTNPCSGVTPEEIAWAYVHEQDGYSNGIAHYIECREGYDRLLDIESYGGKIRDTLDEFAGAEFRDETTKFLFAYDYQNKFTLRVWGSTFKPALAKELKRLGVRIFNHVEATALLMEPSLEEDSHQNPDEGEHLRGAGAAGMDVHTGKFYVFRAKATVLCMSRPARVWLFNPDTVGLCEFRPLPSIGSGHAMGWRAGMELTMMEKSVRAEFSAAGRSFPPYGTGNNHNTWYAATMVDARGVEIPYIDRDGNELKTVSERYYPAKGQKFFLKGGVIDNPKYEYRGPETLDFDTLMERGYKLPFYADLSRMPETERRVIWGMMVGEEAKTKIPIYETYKRNGFDPEKHMLQSYGTGWQSANFLDQERQFFGAPGGIMHDWDLMTNIEGVFAAGDQLFASDCAGAACATGQYAGRKAAAYARGLSSLPEYSLKDVEKEKKRLYAPLFVEESEGISWKELNQAISKAMQNYCGGVRCEALLLEGLDLLNRYETEMVPKLSASNPHDLTRIHEVLDILTVSQIVLYASLFRKSSSKPLQFTRSDYPQMDPPEDQMHIVLRKENGQLKSRRVPLNYFGDLKEEYEKHNQDYLLERQGDSASFNWSEKTNPVMTSQGKVSKEPVRQETIIKEGSLTGFEEAKNAETKGASDFSGISYTAQPVPCSTRPLRFDEKLCIGCGRCAAVCQCDVLLPSKEKGKHPEVFYPGECYYCGACVMSCPRPGAITLEHPLMNQAKFVPVKR